MRRMLAWTLVLCASTPAFARADIGEPVQAALARVQSLSRQLRAASIDRGTLAQPHTDRWKLTAREGDEQSILAIDADTRTGRIVRETFIRFTQADPYSFAPHHEPGSSDLRDVLSPQEYADFRAAAAVTTVRQQPLHALAHFLRGRLAAYEVIEPELRRHAGPDRFEWRSFPSSGLQRAIAAARACNNGDDCAAWF